MVTSHLTREFYTKQSELAHGFAIRSQDSFADYVNDLQKLDSDINNRVRLLLEGYAQELRAAASGDDALERSSAAYRNLQREYAKLGIEYGKAWQEIHTKFAGSVQGVQADTQLQELDGMIDYLRKVRQAMSQGRPESEGGEETS